MGNPNQQKGSTPKIPGTPEEQNAVRRNAKQRKQRSKGRFNSTDANLLDEMAAMRLEQQINNAMTDPRVADLREGSLMANAAETWFQSFKIVPQGKGNFQRATELAKKTFAYSTFPADLQKRTDRAFKLASDCMKTQLFGQPEHIESPAATIRAKFMSSVGGGRPTTVRGPVSA